ncbi:S9 family peptidase [Massilibacteroides sp.]|uniref:S9 family peptidase n=1 Tax=Massilibacteroides sp. TaxID=2034766 RepID=UPI00261E5A4A|nr:S9 family peptidase [Massilibacteroides sp.]MDD4516228.1 S9 family peptidase [Massilibacteroides sp.]
MRQTGLFLLFWLGVVGNLFAQSGSKRVNLKDITDGKFRQITNVGEMRSLPDGEHYTAMNKEHTMVIKFAYRTGNPVDTLFNVEKARECTFDKFDNYMISSTGHRILLFKDTEYVYRRSSKSVIFDYDVRRNFVKPLTEAAEKQMIPTFSPDGRMCAYVRGNNIWVKKFDYDTEVQVTKDGEINKILNGITDWVYEEEFSVTNLMAWSPDSEYLTYVRFDETDVPEFSMQIYGDETYPGYYNFKYPKAGENNSKVTVHSYSIETKDIKELKVPMDADGYIPRITFTKNSDQLAVMTLNRHQNVFSMYYANPKSGVFRLVLREENKAYIDSEWLTSIHFTNDAFTYVSEQDGYAHIYLYSPTGVMQRQVTKGNWDVTDFIGIDEATKAVYYQSAEESPLRRAVYRIDAKGVKTKLSASEGTNRAVFSSNFAYYVNYNSDADNPSRITVNETKSQKELRVLQDNSALKSLLAEYAYSPKEFMTVQTASGYDLNAWIVKPVNFDASRKYPVLMVQYSGPNSQQVLDSYDFGWEQYLASAGFVVVSVDGRGTGARGEAFRKCTYLRLGELEARDQVEAARALGALPFVDSKRIGIWGWSFGGYTTLMSMSVGDGTFKAGIAVAPPTDWKYYDTVYTERFMRTPKENFEGYAATSPIKLATKLQGKLLLIHGTADDNVHFHQTLDYAEALVQAGKQFDMQIYKDRNHSIYGGNTRYHLYTKMSNFLLDNL